MLPSVRRAARTSWPWINAFRLHVASHTSSSESTTFPMAPGGLVNICCSDPSTTVEVGNGAEDEVSLQVQHQAAETTAAGSSPTTTSSSSSSSSSTSSSRFSTHVLGTSRSTILDVVEAAVSSNRSQAGNIQLCTSIPSRFCGLSVSTAGGGVAVGQIQEAEMQLVTRGGPAAVKRCKAMNASISTAREPQHGGRGGDIQVGELSASILRVNSGGGDVTLSRVFGLEAELLSSGGELSINALYGKKASLLSGGGRMRISHMSCDGLAAVDSAGAQITIDGLEGNASILSGGGDIKVHVHEAFSHVFVDSSGGDVEAWISPAAALSLQVAAAKGIQLDAALKVTGELSNTTLHGVTGSSSSSRSWSDQQQMQWQPRQQHDVRAAGHSHSSSDSQNYSRLRRAADEVASMAAATATGASHSCSTAEAVSASGCCKASRPMSGTGSGAAAGTCSSVGVSHEAGVRQLTINAGAGRVVLKCMGWMDGIRAKLQAQNGTA